MYSIKDSVDLSKMKRIGILTVRDACLYDDVSRYMTDKAGTPTQFFYNKLKSASYQAGDTSILSTRGDTGMTVAKLDNDAIFLYSENEVMSAEDFVHIWVKLFESVRSTSIDLERSIYARFGFDYLYMNFVNLALTTGMTPEVMQEYLESFERMKDRKTTYTAKEDDISVRYHGKDGVIGVEYSSQNGKSTDRFLDAMINISPDIRLLMSNTIVTSSRMTLKDVLVEAIRNSERQYYSWSEKEIASLVESKLASGKPIDEEKEQKFYEAFRKESERNKARILDRNKKYKVFPAFSHVMGLFGDKEEEEEQDEIDTKYMLEWYEGDPDNGIQAINYALGMMSRQMQTEQVDNPKAIRNQPQVNDYMAVLADRTQKLNSRAKRREQQAKIHY